jgi:GDP-L-fucose synthase
MSILMTNHSVISLSSSRIVITGGAGFLGQAVCKFLREQGAKNLYIPRSVDYDLREKSACQDILQKNDLVIHLAATVGGIGFNREKPGTLFYDNLMMGMHLMESARMIGVQKFLTVGSICAYPKFTPVPFEESALWDGYPEETNAPYGIAKKALWVMGDAYAKQYQFPASYVLPVNLYGPGDNFDPRSSHVIPALIKKIYDAQSQKKDHIVCWGDGSATREFLYVDDAARGIVAALLHLDHSDPLNLGNGQEISIKALVECIAQHMEYEGELVWDKSQPNGQPRRCLSVEKAAQELQWHAKVSLSEGLAQTIQWYRQHRKNHN